MKRPAQSTADLVILREAAAEVGISLSAAYERVNNREWPVVHVGPYRVWHVPRASLDRLRAIEGVREPRLRAAPVDTQPPAAPEDTAPVVATRAPGPHLVSELRALLEQVAQAAYAVECRDWPTAAGEIDTLRTRLTALVEREHYAAIAAALVHSEGDGHAIDRSRATAAAATCAA